MNSQKFIQNLTQLQSNLLNYAFILSSHREGAYDLLNRTTAQLKERRHSYSSTMEFKDWAFAMMRAVYMSGSTQTSTRRARLNRVLAEEEIILEAESLATENKHVMSERTLRSAYHNLDDSVREVYRRHVVGYTVDEIAHGLMMRSSDVRRHIIRAHRLVSKAV